MKDRDIYIYVLKDPISNEIRYVGKTIQKVIYRFSSHVSSAKYNRKKDYCHCWIKSLLNKGLLPIYEVIEVTNDINREVYWVSYFKSICNLTNLTVGGDQGCLGHKWTLPEEKRKPKFCKKIYLFNLDGNIERVFNSIKEFSNTYGFTYTTSSKYATNNYKINNKVVSFESVFPTKFVERKYREVECYKGEEFLCTFKTVKEAAINLHIDNSAICKLLKGVTKSNRKGLTFKYV